VRHAPSLNSLFWALALACIFRFRSSRAFLPLGVGPLEAFFLLIIAVHRGGVGLGPFRRGSFVASSLSAKGTDLFPAGPRPRISGHQWILLRRHICRNF